MLDLLTSLLNNHKLLRLQSLLPVCLHRSVNNPQMPDLNGLEEAGGGGWCQSPPPAFLLELLFFFLKFYVQGLGPVKTQ